MPRRGIEVPAGAEQSAVGKGHRDPTKPVTRLINSTRHLSRPAETAQLKVARGKDSDVNV
jgi:hypothetical protein